jgi:hypothetical protein
MKTATRFNASKTDAELIRKIATRYCIIGGLRGKKIDLFSVQMTVTAVHCNGNPLHLREFLSAPQDDFLFDMFGISRHYDMDSKVFRNGFVPRFSALEQKRGA